jgi:hypothetical protein
LVRIEPRRRNSAARVAAADDDKSNPHRRRGGANDKKSDRLRKGEARMAQDIDVDVTNRALTPVGENPKA